MPSNSACFLAVSAFSASMCASSSCTRAAYSGIRVSAWFAGCWTTTGSSPMPWENSAIQSSSTGSLYCGGTKTWERNSLPRLTMERTATRGYDDGKTRGNTRPPLLPPSSHPPAPIPSPAPPPPSSPLLPPLRLPPQVDVALRNKSLHLFVGVFSGWDISQRVAFPRIRHG